MTRLLWPGCIWGVWMVAVPVQGEMDLVARILGLAMLLGVRLAVSFSRVGPSRLLRTAEVLQVPAAVIAIISFQVVPGARAAVLTLPWLVECGLLALWGLARILPRNDRPVEEVLVSIGLIYLPVGGIWLLASRYGHGLIGFTEPLVLLTAIHFHYAGCMAPCLTGAVGRGLPPGHRPYRILATGVALGPPLVALGIAGSPWLETVAGATLGTCLLGIAALALLVVRPRLASASARAGLAVASLAGTGALLLAVSYALRTILPQVALSILDMIRTHGWLNSVGFTTLGLVACQGLTASRLGVVPPCSRLRSRGRLGRDFFEREGLLAPDRVATGLIDDFESYRRPDFDPDHLPSEVRRFYEHTADGSMEVTARWSRLFAPVGAMYKVVSDRLEQMNFPGLGEGSVESRILPVRDEADGRTLVRAWVRNYRTSGKTLYVAAYSSHLQAGVRYMNIAFPVPFGNVTSILRLDESSGALRLSTLGAGDQGVYLVTGLLPIRTPMNETIDVWRSAPDQLEARHQVWFCGLLMLTLGYVIKTTRGN